MLTILGLTVLGGAVVAVTCLACYANTAAFGVVGSLFNAKVIGDALELLCTIAGAIAKAAAGSGE